MFESAFEEALLTDSRTKAFEIPDVFVEPFQDFMNGGLRYLGFHGGRAGGKTHSIAKILLCIGWMFPTRILCGREFQKSIADSVKTVLDDQIGILGFQDFYHSIQSEIVGDNGTRFFFSGLHINPESVRGKEGIDIFWGDEAHMVSQKSLNILIPTIRKPGSKFLFSWNPRTNLDPIDNMFRGGHLPPNGRAVEVNYYDNPFVSEETIQDMEFDKRRDYDRYRHVWLGEYEQNSEARIFKNWVVDTFETPEDATFYYGADWGFGNPTVLIRLWISGRTLYIDNECYRIGCPIDETPKLFDQIENGHARKWKIRADSARPDTIDYMRKHGYPQMIAADKGPSSIMDGIEFLKSYDIVIHPRCKHTIDEFTHYSWKVDPHTGDVLPILADKDNHVIDSARYALEQVRKYRTIPKLGMPIQVSVNLGAN